MTSQHDKPKQWTKRIVTIVAIAVADALILVAAFAAAKVMLLPFEVAMLLGITAVIALTSWSSRSTAPQD